MRKIMIVAIGMLLVLMAIETARVEAAETGTITITVTLESISVSVAPENWVLGKVAADSTFLQSCSAENDGNISEDLGIAVDNSSFWVAGSGSGADVFALGHGPTGGPYVNITNADEPLTSGLAVGATHNFELQFQAPSSSTSPDEQTITVTVTASAA